ncbi:MAG TPA: pectin acetylesterase [Sellimonas intestinalis]|nr:pectin acetylesterase [Sellimonas intestinalis]
MRSLTPEQQKLYDSVMADPYPELPEDPETGTWYKVSLPGCVCSCGKPYYAYLKIGSENKLMVMFEGGGVAINEYTAARPGGLFYAGTQRFYFDDVDFLSMGATMTGIGANSENNPFADWSVLCIGYASGDFHTGTASGSYVDGDGDVIQTHFHGYEHLCKLMEITKKWVPEPEALLVTGFSAGGFATSILTDDVISYYPDCKNIVCCVDSAILLYDDWHKAAVELWGSPAHISERLKTRDFSYDGLTALYQKYGSRVKYLYLTSMRDCLLSQYQNYIDHGVLEFTKEAGDRFEDYVKTLYQRMKAEMPEMVYYFFDLLEPAAPEEMGLTVHTLIASERAFDGCMDGISASTWIMDAVNRNPKSVGLSLVE